MWVPIESAPPRVLLKKLGKVLFFLLSRCTAHPWEGQVEGCSPAQSNDPVPILDQSLWVFSCWPHSLYRNSQTASGSVINGGQPEGLEKEHKSTLKSQVALLTTKGSFTPSHSVKLSNPYGWWPSLPNNRLWQSMEKHSTLHGSVSLQYCYPFYPYHSGPVVRIKRSADQEVGIWVT